MNQLEDIDDLCHRIDRFSALTHLVWGLWATVQSHISEIDFDYANYAKLRFNYYKNLKPVLFENIQNQFK